MTLIVVDMHLSGIKYILVFYAITAPNIIFADYVQLLTRLIYLLVYHLLSTNLPPMAMVNTNIGQSIELWNLAKIHTNNLKYGSWNDSFTFKIAIFHYICSRINVLPKTKMKIFPTILKKSALNYYYSNISISAVVMNFDQICNFIRNYFEEVKFKQSVLLK